jgi:hypothetical protein
MIDRKELNKEKMKQSSFIPKPSGNWFDQPNPEGMGLHHMQKPKNKRKTKKRK